MKLKNFINLNEYEKNLVLKWRNSKNVQKWMHTKNISLKEHLEFIENLKDSKSKNYFLVLDDKSYLGVIYLVENYLGLYANPDKKGVGDLLLKQIIDFAFKQKNLPLIKAEVFKDNLRAIKLYKKHKFKLIKENNKLLIMELIKENR